MVLEAVDKLTTVSTGCGARWAVDNYGKSQSCVRMGLQLKRPGWCVNTSESGPNPDKEGYVNTTPVDPAAVDRIRDYLRGAESRVCDVMDQPESAAFHYFSGAATAARACLVYLGADD